MCIENLYKLTARSQCSRCDSGRHPVLLWLTGRCSIDPNERHGCVAPFGEWVSYRDLDRPHWRPRGGNSNPGADRRSSVPHDHLGLAFLFAVPRLG